MQIPLISFGTEWFTSLLSFADPRCGSLEHSLHGWRPLSALTAPVPPCSHSDHRAAGFGWHRDHRHLIPLIFTCSCFFGFIFCTTCFHGFFLSHRNAFNKHVWACIWGCFHINNLFRGLRNEKVNIKKTREEKKCLEGEINPTMEKTLLYLLSIHLQCNMFGISHLSKPSHKNCSIPKLRGTFIRTNLSSCSRMLTKPSPTHWTQGQCATVLTGNWNESPAGTATFLQTLPRLSERNKTKEVVPGPTSHTTQLHLIIICFSQPEKNPTPRFVCLSPAEAEHFHTYVWIA